MSGAQSFAQGLSNKLIARRLGISDKTTVKGHLKQAGLHAD